MEKTIDCRGMACPLPVVNAKKASEELHAGDVLTVLVDNEVAVQNLQRFASHKGYVSTGEKKSDKEYAVVITITGAEAAPQQEEIACGQDTRKKGMLVVLSANTMGTCLDFYGIRDKLAVGSVTNMYEIVERMETAGHIVKP